MLWVKMYSIYFEIGEGRLRSKDNWNGWGRLNDIKLEERSNINRTEFENFW